MTTKQGPMIFINSDNLAEADFMSRNFVNKEIKNRAFINTLGAEALIKYLTMENVNLKNIRNIHSIARVLENIDIADIMMPNIHIDVRVVFDENQIFIPKTHFDYEIQPDVYVVLKLGANFEYFELLGFFEPKNMNLAHQNSQYYFYENYKLSSPANLIKFIKTFQKQPYEKLNDEEFSKGQELSISLADHDITDAEFQILMKLLVRSAQLRDSVLEYDNFETLSLRVGNLLNSSDDSEDVEHESVEAKVARDDEQNSGDSSDEGTEFESDTDTDTDTDAEADTEEDTQTVDEIFGQDLTFDSESLEEAEEIPVLDEIEPVENQEIEEIPDEIGQEEKESVGEQEEVLNEEVQELDSSFFENESESEAELVDLTDEFFNDDDKGSEESEVDTGISSAVIGAGLGAAAIAGTEIAGAEIAGAAAASELTEVVSDLAEIPQIGEELVDFDENTEIDSSFENSVSDEVINLAAVSGDEPNIEPHQELLTDENIEQDLVLDETTTNLSDLEPIETTTEAIEIPEAEETIDFNELESTLDLTQETVVDFENDVVTNFDDLSTIENEIPQLTENSEEAEDFTNFSDIEETAPEQTLNSEDDNGENTDILQDMPETTTIVEETEADKNFDIDNTQEDIVNFSDINSEENIPIDINSNLDEENNILQDISEFEQYQNTSENTGEFNFDTEAEQNSLEDFDNFSSEDKDFHDFSENQTAADEQQIPDEVFDLTDEEPLDKLETLQDTLGETESSENEIQITDEDNSEQIAAQEEAVTNSVSISDTEFTPGEIPIDINNPEEFATEEAQHLESIYNDSNNFQDANLNNSTRFVHNNNPKKGPSKVFVGISAILVLAIVAVIGLSALNVFNKPSSQEEPQPVSDNDVPQSPQIPEQVENPNTLKVDTNKVVTMDNKQHAPIAQPAVAQSKPQQTQAQAPTQKLPATAFLQISKLSWEVPDYISANANFRQYFQSTGKSLKAALSSDLLLANDYIYSKQVRLSVTFNQNGSFKESRMLMSSGSTQVDKIVLQSVNQTLNVLKAPNSLGNDQSTTVILKIYF